MRLRSILVIALAAVLGPWLLYSADRDYQNNRRLATEGSTTDAQVLACSVQPRTKGEDRHYLSVHFQTEAGEAIKTRVLVNKDEYLKAEAGQTVPLRYLASAPTICAVGEPVPTWRGGFTSGTMLLLSGGVLVLLSRRRLSTHEAAQKVVESVGALCESHYEYALVDAKEFSHLDLDWYQGSQRWLGERGFVFLGDEENLTFQRTSKGNRTLLRTMLGRDGTWLAYLYHFKSGPPGRARAGTGLKALELQTHFTNGLFVCTNNVEAAGKLDSPPGVDALRLPANTPFESILAIHAQRVTACLANNPGVAVSRMAGLEEVHRVQNILQEIKAAYRRNTGITREELQRLAGHRLCPEQIEALHADVTKLHAERQRNAA